MLRVFLAASLFSTFAVSAFAQDAKPAEPAPLQLTTQQDHKLMMEALKIESLRRGADGMNRNAANAANYDESKVNAFTLPDPLVCKDGTKVTTPEQWRAKRRPEIVEEFDREVYGRVPKDVPKVTWEVTGTTEEKVGEIPAITKKLVGHVDNAMCPQIKVDIQLTLTTPADARGPVPVMMEFGFGGFGPRPGGPPGKAATKGGDASKTKAAPRFGPPGAFGGGGPSWQQQVLAKGWGYAIIVPNSIQADNGAGLTKGIIGLCNKGQARKPEDWGSLRAWAWGASRALDYFETDKAVDAKQVGIEGLSRYGKAAIVTMAYDQRFAIGFIGSSGEGGAKLHRRNFGELVENLTGSGEYHWMAGNFLKYGGPLTPNDLPVDAHELIALCAPRPTFISYGASTGQGAEGQWVDQRGSFQAAVAAGPVFKLLGKKDLGTAEFPEVETGLTDGDLAFRQHKGGHTTGPNWPTFLKFADRYIKAEPVKSALPRSSPESQGVSSVALLEFVDAADKTIESMNSLMVLRHGNVVAEGWWTPYNAASPHSLYSLSKSFTSTAVGLAIAEGKLSLDDEVLKFFPDDAPASPSNNLKAMRVSDLLRMSTGHQSEPPHPVRALDQDLPRARRSQQAGHALPLQYVGHLHALGDRPKSHGADCARLPEAPPLRSPRHREPDVGSEPARDLGRRLRPERPHRGYCPVRPALSAKRQVGRQAGRPRELGRGGHGAPDFKRQQPEERLGPRLRLPVLALPQRCVSRRWSVRAILHRDPRTGRRGRDHQRREGHAGRPEPRLGQAPARHEACPADSRR